MAILYEFYYAAKIDALISDGKANILARPNITTIQGKEAVINIGSEVPVLLYQRQIQRLQLR